MGKIKVLSLPSRHPYTSKFNTGNIEFVNPNTDLLSLKNFSIEYLNEHYPLNTYNVVHIHFSFDKLGVNELQDLLLYFKKNGVPIIWTLHSKESQRIRNYGNGKYQELLFNYSDRIISPTEGAKEWLNEKLGKHYKEIEIIPLGFMSNPIDVERIEKVTQKNQYLFTMLVGEFRENKEFLQSIINFLQCTDLEKYTLQLIFKPIVLYNKDKKLLREMKLFYNLIQHPRIKILSKPEITNDELNKAFIESHAIILFYKWGTHSGQIEQAKDCGCNVVASNVGFYTEQWSDAILFDFDEMKPYETACAYTEALIEATKRPSIKPFGQIRLEELNESIKKHLKVYKKAIQEVKNAQ